MDQDNFNSGELGPNLWRRPKLAAFQNGCAMAQNFIPLVEGPLRRRAGFWHNGTPKYGNQTSRLVAFVRAADEAYVIELGNAYTRFWGVDGQPIRVGGSPYEISAPYLAADLAGLRWKQLEDVIVFFHADGRQPWRLEKLSETSWNWAAFSFEDGPWAPENTDQSKTIWTNRVTGSGVTVSASFPAFFQIGQRFRLRASNGLPGVKTWQPDEDPNGNALRLSNGRVYYAGVGTAETGNTPPSHDSGTMSDGGVDWTYLHDNSGEFVITAISTTQSATATVVRTLPTLGTDFGNNDLEYRPGNTYALPATFAWAESAYSDYRGWPSAWPELREERLVVGGARSSKSRYHASQTGGYSASRATFTPGLGTGAVLDDDAITGFAGDDSFKVMGFLSGPLLVAFTHGGEGVIVGDTGEALLTPEGAKPRALSRYGSADVRPIKAQDALLFVTRGNRSLRDLRVSTYDYPGQSSDLSFIAKHIARRKFVEADFCAAPDYILWVRLADGGLASMVYNREQNVYGWSRHVLGGECVVESLCVVPDPIGNDRLWAIVRREKDGAPQRMVWMMSEPDDGVRLDGAVRYYNGGAAATELAGAGHLAGETARVAVRTLDGRYAWAGDLTVSGAGVVTLQDGPAIEAAVGLPYVSRFESLPLIRATQQGSYQRATRANVAFEGVGCEAGTVGGGDPERWNARKPTDIDGITAQEHIAKMDLASNHETDARVYVETASVHDMTLKSINMEFAR